MKISAAWLLALALAAGTTVAADRYVPIEQRLTPEQRHATGIDTLSPEQLAALNAVLSGERETIRVQEEARAEAELKRRPRPDDAPGSIVAGLDQEPIRSRVIGVVGGWEPGTEFKLANGQVWKVLKGSMKLRKPMTEPEIVVVPGLMGRWFLQVDEDLPKARVYRVD